MGSHAALIKVGVFVLVQALVYLILAQSSGVFSRTKSVVDLRPARSLSARRMVALLSDLPLGGEPSPRAVFGGEQSLVPSAHQKKD